MYHYGLTIKEYRERAKITQAQLAERWPKADGGEGVSVDYVSLVERGRRFIDDITTLRKLCDILKIPYWQVGLSEYNPFDPVALPGKGRYLYNETLDAIEELINNAWALRRTATFPLVARNVSRLQGLFQGLDTHASKPARLEFRYNALYAQLLRLQGMVYVEQKNEASAHEAFAAMHAVAKEIHDPAALALACVGLGMGQARRENHAEAVRYLEAARDYTFETSRQLTGMVLSFLARAYAKDHDRYRFEQAIDTALHIAARLNGEYSNGADFSSHSLSDILEEESNGYVELGLGRETLVLRQDIERVIEVENNNYMRAWLPLDFAQAYMTMGEAEESIKELRDFYGRIQTLLQSPLGLAKVTAHMRQLAAQGYGEVGAVREFAEALHAEPEA